MSNKYYSPDGNLEVWDKKPEGYYTEEEWAELHPAPPQPEPTTEEKLAALDADYNQQKQDLINEYTDAQIHGDEDTITLVQQEMTELDEWYDEEYRKIEGGE
jgi:DNA-binding ferritin-like protein